MQKVHSITLMTWLLNLSLLLIACLSPSWRLDSTGSLLSFAVVVALHLFAPAVAVVLPAPAPAATTVQRAASLELLLLLLLQALLAHCKLSMMIFSVFFSCEIVTTPTDADRDRRGSLPTENTTKLQRAAHRQDLC